MNIDKSYFSYLHCTRPVSDSNYCDFDVMHNKKINRSVKLTLKQGRCLKKKYMSDAICALRSSDLNTKLLLLRYFGPSYLAVINGGIDVLMFRAVNG